MHNRSYYLLALSFATAFLVQAATEIPGAKDSPVISRYAGSVLQSAATESFATVRVPSGPGRFDATDKLVFDRSVGVEGRVGAYFYVVPKERTALEVFRNYQAALSQAGFAAMYSCEMRACDQAPIREPFAGEIVRSRKWAGGRGDPSRAVSRDIRFVSAKDTRDGADVNVMVFVAEPDSV